MKLTKIIAFILTSALTLGILPISAYAAESRSVSTAAEFTPSATIMPVYGAKKAILSPTFDDSLYTTATFINELCEEYDLRASIMMWCNRIGSSNSNMADAETWAELFAKGYLEPQNHSMTHMDLRDTTEKGQLNQDPEKFKSEIIDSKILLEELFPEYDFITYAIPYGGMSSAAKELAQQHNYALRGVYGGDYQNLNPSVGTGRGTWGNLISPGAGTNYTTGESQINYLKGCVDAAVKYGGWYAPFIHAAGDVSNTEMSSYVTTEYFKHMGTYQASGEAWCTTFSNATKYIRERQNATPVLRFDGSKIYLKLDLAEKTADNLSLPLDVFNHPLTVKVKIPSDFKSACCKNAEGEFISSTKFTEKGESYIYVDIVPDGKEIEIGTVHQFESFTNIDDESHMATCKCGYSEFKPHEINSYGYCDKCSVGIAKISLSVGEALSLNYYSYLNTYDFSRTAVPSMKFTVGTSETTVTEYTKCDDYFIFTVENISPADMSVGINAELLVDGKAVDSKLNYSPEKYCKEVLGLYPANTKIQNLINDLLVYGRTLEKQIKGTETIGSGITLVPTVRLPEESDNIKAVTGNENTKLFVDSAKILFGKENRLVFKIYAEETDFNVYITSADSDFAVRYSKDELEDDGGGFYTAATRALHPEYFDGAVTLKIADANGDTVSEYTYSPNTYAYEISENPSAASGEKTTTLALYRLGKSLEDYLKN